MMTDSTMVVTGRLGAGGCRVEAVQSRQPLRTVRTSSGEHIVECPGELGVTVADQESKAVRPVVEIHRQVPGLPPHPTRSGER
jgi:hypothetical protein